jgi:hypothetical protein
MSHSQDIQSFINSMFAVQHTSHHSESGPEVVHGAVRRTRRGDGVVVGIGPSGINSREVWFSTEFFGFPCATYVPKHPIQEANHATKVSTMIHEFAHHVVMETYGQSVKPHGKEFWKIHRSIEAGYGIFTIPFVNTVIPIPKFWCNLAKSKGGEQP